MKEPTYNSSGGRIPDLFSKLEDVVFVASPVLLTGNKADATMRCYDNPMQALYGAVVKMHEDRDIRVKGNVKDLVKNQCTVYLSTEVPDTPLHLYYFHKKLRTGTSTALIGEETMVKKSFVVPSWKNFLLWESDEGA